MSRLGLCRERWICYDGTMNREKPGIYIPPGRKVWAHEMRVAKVLAMAGHDIEFLLEGSQRSPDIRLDGVEFEIKSPKTSSVNTLEHLLKDGLKQCSNLIIDSSRTKMRDDRMKRFLVAQVRSRRQMKRALLVTKRGQIIDICELI